MGCVGVPRHTGVRCISDPSRGSEDAEKAEKIPDEYSPFVGYVSLYADIQPDLNKILLGALRYYLRSCGSCGLRNWIFQG